MPVQNFLNTSYITGLMVIERNWLDVYPYTNWGGNSNLPVFRPGDTFTPSELLLQSVRLLTCTVKEHLSSLMPASMQWSGIESFSRYQHETRGWTTNLDLNLMIAFFFERSIVDSKWYCRFCDLMLTCLKESLQDSVYLRLHFQRTTVPVSV